LAAAFATTDQQRAAPGIEVALSDHLLALVLQDRASDSADR
jgi:hypothetical protein